MYSAYYHAVQSSTLHMYSEYYHAVDAMDLGRLLRGLRR
jgi:hypothetical protein